MSTPTLEVKKGLPATIKVSWSVVKAQVASQLAKPLRPPYEMEKPVPDRVSIPELCVKIEEHMNMMSVTRFKEVYEMPTGFRAERLVANIMPAPSGFVKAIKPNSFDLNPKLIERDDVYYIFSMWDANFLAKREGNVIKVFEAFESKDGKILALPHYEVEI